MQPTDVPSLRARTLIAWTIGVTLVAACFWIVLRFHRTVLLIITALIVSIVVRPGVLRLEQRGVARPIGIAIIFGAIMLLLGGFSSLALPVIIEQSAELQQGLDEVYQVLRGALRGSSNILLHRLLLLLPSDLVTTGAESGSQVTADERTLSDSLQSAGMLLFAFLRAMLVPLLAFYWTLHGEYFKQAAFLLAPPTQRTLLRDVVDEIEGKISAYVWGQGTLCIIIGLLAFGVYLLIGLPHALLLAIFMGLLEAIPIVGPILGAAPAVVIALSISPVTALWVVLATAIIQQLENSVLVPRIMSRAVGVGPLVSLISLVAFSSLFGILGALIALPLAAIGQLLINRFLLAPDDELLLSSSRDRYGALRYEAGQLVQDVRNQLRRKEDMPSALTDALEDEVEAIAVDLEQFLAEQSEIRREA